MILVSHRIRSRVPRSGTLIMGYSCLKEAICAGSSSCLQTPPKLLHRLMAYVGGGLGGCRESSQDFLQQYCFSAFWLRWSVGLSLAEASAGSQSLLHMKRALHFAERKLQITQNSWKTTLSEIVCYSPKMLTIKDIQFSSTTQLSSEFFPWMLIANVFVVINMLSQPAGPVYCSSFHFV